jgi:hypothetical protein
VNILKFKRGPFEGRKRAFWSFIIKRCHRALQRLFDHRVVREQLLKIGKDEIKKELAVEFPYSKMYVFENLHNH